MARGQTAEMSSLNYKFANLLGAPYRGGNLLLHGTELLSAVGNRVSQVSEGGHLGVQ